MNLDTESGNVLLLELASQVALDEGGLVGVGCVSDGICRGRSVGQIFILIDNRGARGKTSCSSAIAAANRRSDGKLALWGLRDASGVKSAYLASTTVTDQDELEGGWGLRFSHGGRCDDKSR